MSRSRYVILEPDKPLTCTVVEWLPVFTHPDAVQIILDSWAHQRLHDGLQLFGYMVLENRLHFVAQAPRLDKCLSSFKSYTAARLIELLQAHQAERLLTRLRFAKRAHKTDRDYQFWQEGSHAEMVFSEDVMRQKLDYIHHNPVKRGYVDLPEHWRYSSARNYLGQPGKMAMDRWCVETQVVAVMRRWSGLGLRSHAGAWERLQPKVSPAHQPRNPFIQYTVYFKSQSL